MGLQTNQCCCAGPGDLYVSMQFRFSIISPPSAQIWKYNGETGSNALFYTPATTAAATSLCCDRSGNLYFLGGGSSQIFKVDASGTLLWSITPASTLNAICVGQGGYLYACGGNVRRRYLMSTGTEVPRAVAGNGYGDASFATTTFSTICVDQNETVYIGGRVATVSSALFRLDSEGIILNTVGPTETLASGVMMGSIALNAANTALVVTLAGTSPTLPNIFTYDPTGSLTTYTKVVHGGGIRTSAYSPDGAQYAAGRKGTSSITVRRNGLSFFSGEQDASVVCGPDNSVFISQLRPTASPNYSVMRDGVWGVDAGSQYTPIGLEPYSGRIGAFGNL